ncbi:2-hydroxyacid dehydrogenase [Rahnella sp. SL6]|uniref:2-hydroxyacid dehydrogenase n=1 Tax=Rahnella perminowiae TaxID=2816244 RepID=UPI001C254B8A|nr:2-hydroxyacid dehydrogenase [Rahnella perminowiae]MBU9809461.1 2-hydroxyacid dehydrogenase [Rahnella perminowiae]
MTIALLSHIELDAGYPGRFEAAGFCLYFATSPEQRANLDPQIARQIRGVLTIGSIGLSATEMEVLPALEIICAQGVGFEHIDVAAARQRGIHVTNGPGTNNASVADHTLALMLAITRRIPQFDAAVRTGEWKKTRWNTPGMAGKRLGIIGLGNIGALIARRASGGFDMEIGYHNRRQQEDSPYRYFLTTTDLAEWADYLVVATPGGKNTVRLVDAAVLHALGPEGFLINIARGSVVDSAALIASLHNNVIAGAALDVVDGEPQVPPEMFMLDNLVLTPHVAGRSPESVENMLTLVLANLEAHFSGKPVMTPVPE